MDLLDSEPLPLKYLQPSSTEDEEEKAHSDNGCMSDETADHSQEYHKYVSPRRHSLGRDRDTKKRDDYKVKARYAALRGRAVDNGTSRNEYVPTAHVSPRSSSIHRSPSHREWVEPRLRQTNSVEDLLHRPSLEPSNHKQYTDAGLNKWNSYTNIDRDEFSAMNVTLDQTQIGEHERPTVTCAPIQSNLTLPSRSYYVNRTNGTGHQLSQPSSMYSKSRDLTNVRPSSAYHEAGLSYTTPPQGMIDMTEWQQQQSHAAGISQNLFGSTGTTGPGVSPPMNPYLRPHKLDALTRAADDRVTERDLVIDRQKQKILQLQNENNMLNHREQMSQVQDENAQLAVKLQDTRYENTQLKLNIQDLENAHSIQMEELQKKLGKVESDYWQFQLQTNKENAAREKEIANVQKKLDEQENQSMEWKAKFHQLKQSQTALQQNKLSLEGYMADLPSAEDYVNLMKERKSLHDRNSKYKAKIQELAKEVAKLQESLNKQIGLVNSLESMENQHVAEISRYKKQLADLRGDNAGVAVDDDEKVQLKKKNQQLHAAVSKMQTMLEKSQKKSHSLEARVRNAERHQEALQQDDSVAAMMREVRERNAQITQLHTKHKELSDQHQDMMNENMILKGHLKTLTDKSAGAAGETQRLQDRLYTDLSECLNDLQALVQICVQRSQGQDPNLSVLLGARAYGVQEAHTPSSTPNAQTLNAMIDRVHEMKADVDTIRELISNKYAEDMGDNITCVTQ